MTLRISAISFLPARVATANEYWRLLLFVNKLVSIIEWYSFLPVGAFCDLGVLMGSQKNEQDFHSSLVQGIFVHKTSSSKKKKNVESEALWHKQYSALWSEMEMQIQDVEKNAYKETFSDLVKFVKEYHSTKLVTVREVPAAILVMGVNMPDHSNIFSILENEMHSNDLPITVVLQSKDCNSISALMQKLVNCVINKYQQEMCLEEKVLKKVDCTFSQLMSFYKNLPDPKVQKSPRKKKKTDFPDLKSKPIVIMMKDVEAFSPDVLQQLILMCNLYVMELPIILVFGMASAMYTLHNILSQKALCCLGIETFHSMTAIEYLTKIIQKVVMSLDNPFKLGPRVFQLIVDAVLYHDFSVSNLTCLLKFCIFEHFYANDAAYVCCSPRKIKSHLNALSNRQLDRFRKMSSLSRYVENNPECQNHLKKESSFKSLIATLLEKHHAYYENMIILLNCLFIFVKDLPGYPLGKHLRELYCLSLEGRIAADPAYLEAVKLLKMHSKDDLLSKMQACLEFLKDLDQPKTLECYQEILEILETHQEILMNLSEADYEKEPVVCNESYGDKVLSRAQLKERIQLRIKSKPSKFEKCRENAIESLTSLFKKLHPPSELPLHEVLYFDNAVSLKRHLMTVPRINLHQNLINPQAILKCKCCEISESSEKSPSMPDICLLYKLHLEFGKLINLRDWLEGFKSFKISDEKSSQKKKKGSDLNLDTQLNLRFMQAVSELQILGFIKPTKRKTDHVARLTFESF